MTPLCCLIDRLPVELLHEIFDYLWAHEIFYGFSNLNDYLDAVLISYNRYLVNFRSVVKSQFDLTCYHIRPHQIISLTLSDDEETPDQSELFFSLFDIEQFINLRSFDVTSISDNAFKRLSNLHQLKSLSSFKLPRRIKPYSILFDSVVSKLLPQLSQLLVYNIHYLLNDQLSRLRRLTLMHCCYLQLQTICHRVPNLYSLDITLVSDVSTDWFSKVPPLAHLKRLVLNIYSAQTTMVQIEQLLSEMSYLKHLEVVSQGSMDLIDGQRWELLVSHLITFNFHFHVRCCRSKIPETHIFHSFGSPFWLKHKRWFVAYDERQSSVFTVPRFAPSSKTYSSNYKPLLCTSPDMSLDRYVRCLNLLLFIPPDCRFTNVTSLVLEPDGSGINSALPLFAELVRCVPHLHSLTFWNLSPLAYLPNDIVLEKILTLHVQYTFQESQIRPYLNYERLCTVFPRLERLNMWITRPEDLFLCIDRLKYLSIAKFEFNHFFQLSQVTREWLIQNCQQLKAHKNFTYKIMVDHIHLWMNNSQFQPSDNEHRSRDGSSSCLSRPCCLQ